MFAGLLGGSFGNEIKPYDLINILQEKGYIRLDDSRTRITVLKEFEAYGTVFATKVSTNFPLRKDALEHCYFTAKNNRHLR